MCFLEKMQSRNVQNGKQLLGIQVLERNEGVCSSGGLEKYLLWWNKGSSDIWSKAVPRWFFREFQFICVTDTLGECAQLWVIVSLNLTKVTRPWLVLLPLERINSEITHSVPVVTFCCCYCWKSENICEHSRMYNSRAWITTAFVWVYFGISLDVLVYSICLFA